MSTEAKIIDGKAFAADLRERVGGEVTRLVDEHSLKPGLAVVLVGEDPASEVYVRMKGKATVAAGMKSVEHKLAAETSQEDLLTLVRSLNEDDTVHGILVQLPLPDHMDELAVIATIDPAKDVDGLSVINSGRLFTGAKGMVPCTPLGCMMLIRDVLGDDLSGKRAIVIGRSKLVGKPVSMLLQSKNATVTMAHSRTNDLPAECRRADIVVAAVGQPEMVRGGWIKHGAVVIDVGVNRIPAEEEGKTRLVGDVCFAEVSEKAAAITPVPGGVGPMTIACLLANTVTAACQQKGIEAPVF